METKNLNEGKPEKTKRERYKLRFLKPLWWDGKKREVGDIIEYNLKQVNSYGVRLQVGTGCMELINEAPQPSGGSSQSVCECGKVIDDEVLFKLHRTVCSEVSCICGHKPDEHWIGGKHSCSIEHCHCGEYKTKRGE